MRLIRTCVALSVVPALLLSPSQAAAQARAGGEIRVNTYTTGDQRQSSVAADSRGDFVVVWWSYAYGVRGQLFDRAGARRGAEFQVDSLGFYPAVAMTAQGGFLVVWQRNSGTGDIYGQLFDSAANRRGAELQIQIDAAELDTNPTLAADGQGNFVVVWSSSLDGS